jgi:hypothetical protein
MTGIEVELEPASGTPPGSTVFVVDPALDLTYELYSQLMPSSTRPLRPLLRQLVHQAIGG